MLFRPGGNSATRRALSHASNERDRTPQYDASDQHPLAVRNGHLKWCSDRIWPRNAYPNTAGDTIIAHCLRSFVGWHNCAQLLLSVLALLLAVFPKIETLLMATISCCGANLPANIASSTITPRSLIYVIGGKDPLHGVDSE